MNNFLLILPELLLASAAILILLVETILPKQHSRIVTPIALLSQLAALALLITTGSSTAPIFYHLLQQTPTSQFFRIFLLCASLLTTILTVPWLARTKRPRTEYLHIHLIAAASMMLLAQANNLLSLFVTLETTTIALCLLVAYNRHLSTSLEAGLKYLVNAALCSAITLFGIALLYGAAATFNPASNPLDYSSLQTFFQQSANTTGNSTLLALAGAALLLTGLAFKIGAFPFQFWIPDVYQGAPTPTTATLATASKAAGLAALLALLHGPLYPVKHLTIPLLSILAAATLLFGNIAALTQQNIKRLISLSGVSHAGFLLIAATASLTLPSALRSLEFYLAAYLIANATLFIAHTQLTANHPDDTALTTAHYANLFKNSPLVATALIIALGSLAGIPPLAGFTAKLLVFIDTFNTAHYALLGIALISVVISIYYYFGWIAAIVTTTPANDGSTSFLPPKPCLFGKTILILLALATLLLGVFPYPLTSLLP